MQINELIDRLGYLENPNFVHGDDLGRVADYAHIFRRAQSRMELRGVYVLQQPHSMEPYRSALIPVVYICEAQSEKQASEFRRLTWNQNAAPFLIIRTPANIRLFSTFNYPHVASGTAAGRSPKAILDRRVDFQETAAVLGAFTSRSIDDGTIWRDYGRFVTPKGRVDWSLLESLKKLDALLIGSGLEWRTSHALIGKYVYLWCLRQRDILSDRRLDGWKINHNDVFTRNATLTAFKSVLEELENWLNGSVFPLNWERVSAPKQEHLRKVAGVFAGDTPAGQLHLPFDAYDFSIIPVETLSAIYEQFLHAHEPKKEQPRGKELGAYYTPVPLVNFMLEELNDRRPLKEGMTCFDASCGSGAFLVQCYRRLIESRVRQDGNAIRRPAELRDLLVKHIFGVDRDGDACRVTELSLILTLLDYVDPPDLSPVHNFKLPDLHNSNIFEADFFDPHSTWTKSAHDGCYDWVVGNPPWVELKPVKGDEQKDAQDKDQHARDWINDPANKKEMPVGGNQLAEAFLWKITHQLQPRGIAAMLVPAMTLFKSESKAFRQRFFNKLNVWCVTNFANLAEVLFAGRSREPAVAVFYSKPHQPRSRRDNDRTILTYSPLVANQTANVPDKPRKLKDTWSVTISGSEIREVTAEEASSGDPLVWKAAMWASHLDKRLLDSVSRAFESLDKVCNRLDIEISEGFQLRSKSSPRSDEKQGSSEAVKFVAELVDKFALDPKKLRHCGRLYVFPRSALFQITKERAFLRIRGGERGLIVSRGPHVIVDSARRFAIYSDEFTAIPPRQIGIAAKPEQSALLKRDTSLLKEHCDLLKAMSLYLVSDFALYHQFLCSPKWGIHASIADLKTLRVIPFPLDEIVRSGLNRWSKLHAAIVVAAGRAQPPSAEPTLLWYDGDEPPNDVAHLESELNAMVNDALKLREADTWLISDLIRIRRRLIQGKVDPAAAGSPSREEMRSYCEALKRELDSFTEVATDDRYVVEVIHEQESAMVVAHRAPARLISASIRILSADAQEAKSLHEIRQHLLERHSQWLYFERALRRYERETNTSCLFKPMQRLHWLRSQALIDAGEVIADTATGGGE